MGGKQRQERHGEENGKETEGEKRNEMRSYAPLPSAFLASIAPHLLVKKTKDTSVLLALLSYINITAITTFINDYLSLLYLLLQ